MGTDHGGRGGGWRGERIKPAQTHESSSMKILQSKKALVRSHGDVEMGL